MSKNERPQRTEAQWRSALTAEQYYVCREHGTERPFSGEYNDCKLPGIQLRLLRHRSFTRTS